jgi:hypothetical protein
VSLLPGRSLLPGVRVGNPEVRRALAIAEAGGAAEFGRVRKKDCCCWRGV